MKSLKELKWNHLTSNNFFSSEIMWTKNKLEIIWAFHYNRYAPSSSFKPTGYSKQNDKIMDNFLFINDSSIESQVYIPCDLSINMGTLVGCTLLICTSGIWVWGEMGLDCPCLKMPRRLHQADSKRKNESKSCSSGMW